MNIIYYSIQIIKKQNKILTIYNLLVIIKIYNIKNNFNYNFLLINKIQAFLQKKSDTEMFFLK